MKLQFSVKYIFSVFFMLFFFITGLHAQGTLDDYKRAEQFLQKNLEKTIFNLHVTPHWSISSSRFWYKTDSSKGKEFILVDTKKITRVPAFNHSKMAQSLTQLLKKEYKPYSLPFDSFQWENNDKEIIFNVDSQRIKCVLKTYECTVIQEEATDDSISVSPDSLWTAFVKDYNLFIRENKTAKEFQLTTDGSENCPYALIGDWYQLNNESDPSKSKKATSIGVVWAPDSTKFICHRVDYSKAKKLYLYQSMPKSGYRAQVWSYFRSLPGETDNTMYDYYIFDIREKKAISVDIPSLSSMENWSFPFWFKDSNHLNFYYYSRGYKTIFLVDIDAKTGKCRTVIEESSPTYMDVEKRFINILEHDKQLVWSSERDGWCHLYLYDWSTGQLINQITKGDFVVRSLVYVDKKKRQVYFMASGRISGLDPYLKQLYRINLDGTGLILLTPEQAEHEMSLSPDHKFVTDTFSRVDLPSVSVLRRLKDGKVVLKLENADIKNLLNTGWNFPEAFKAKARDGKTDIYGVIFRPSNFDPSKKYPVIDSTYSGPQAVRTPKSFRRGSMNMEQTIAELGFIVITVDGLGTANRSKEFHDFSYKNLGDIGALDHITAIKQLAQKYPYMDISRVGIYGHSAGGYDAAHALLIHPEFYKVGVSSAGNHDHQMAKAWWPENFQGFPVDKQYVEQSNLTLAKNLQGKLLLVHGDMDNNVNPACTLRFTGELIKANKDFDLIIIPNRDHRLGDHPYFIRKLWDYFVQHLLKVEPPLYEITSYK